MKPAGFLPVLVFAGAACAQNVVSGWMPVQTGTRWIYEHESRDQTGVNTFETRRWKTEEIITGTFITPEGTLIVRHIRPIEGSPLAAYRLNADPAYLIRGSCLYGYGNYGEAAWNPATHQPSPDFLKGLTVGWLAPDFCFPLAAGKTWGAPHGLPDWHVPRPELAKDWQVADVKQQTFHIRNISGYPGSGMTVDIWFEKGAGIVREEEIHHGTIGEVRTRLLRFEPVRTAK